MSKTRIYVSTIMTTNQTQLANLANQATDVGAKQILAMSFHYITKLEEVIRAERPSALTAVRISTLNELAPSYGLQPVIAQGEDSYIEIEIPAIVALNEKEIDPTVSNTDSADGDDKPTTPKIKESKKIIKKSPVKSNG